MISTWEHSVLSHRWPDGRPGQGKSEEGPLTLVQTGPGGSYTSEHFLWPGDVNDVI